uniref:HicA toxin of toxin-antitoxin n=1 Tax=Candidatus Kentrum sp. FW TaxID=2126338 RepID=A0A450TKB3_9GAMM|nr:MAG: hypothetical protein BECKFW1821C_GA0114237_101333 [Candidatus Kentron sp. FW]
MKRNELIKHLERKGCYLLRHGSRHDIYSSEALPQTDRAQLSNHLSFRAQQEIFCVRSLRKVGRFQYFLLRSK